MPYTSLSIHNHKLVLSPQYLLGRYERWVYGQYLPYTSLSIHKHKLVLSPQYLLGRYERWVYGQYLPYTSLSIHKHKLVLSPQYLLGNERWVYGQYLPYTSLSIHNHKLVLSPQYLLGRYERWVYGQYLPYTSLSIHKHKLVRSTQYLLGKNAGCTDSTCPTLAFLYTNTSWYCHLSICWVGKRWVYGQYLPYTSLSIHNHKLVRSPQYLLGKNAGCTDSTCPTLAFLYTNTSWYCHLSICWVRTLGVRTVLALH